MRAVAVNKTGDTPELMELPVPQPGPGEVLVKLETASLNPIDAGIAEGQLPMPSAFPPVLGVDGAGRVVAVGEGVRGFEPGDAVHGQFLHTPLGSGTFAEYMVTPQSPDYGAMKLVPAGVSSEIAAALPTAGMTALGALEAIGLKSGQSILIVDAVGRVAQDRGVRRAQIALAWLLGKPVVNAPLVGATTTQQIDDALASVSIGLSDEEVRELEAPYTPRHDFQGVSDEKEIQAIMSRLPQFAATE
jgi:NADPH:quinone reductase-like Zn-dependent oxidoreductase